MKKLEKMSLHELMSHYDKVRDELACRGKLVEQKCCPMCGKSRRKKTPEELAEEEAAWNEWLENLPAPKEVVDNG